MLNTIRQSNRITVHATAEPIDLGQAKAQCHVEHDAEDTYIGELITRARRYVEGLTNRTMLATTRRLTLDCFPWWEIKLLYPPVQTVSSITYIDGNGTTQTLGASTYLLSTASEPGRITPAYGYTWPATQGRMDSVNVTYVAGYASAAFVPAELKQAMLLWIEHTYHGTLTDKIEASIANLCDQYMLPEYA